MFKIQIRVIDLPHMPPAPEALKQWQDYENMPELKTEDQAKQWLKDNQADELCRLAPGIEFQIVPIQ